MQTLLKNADFSQLRTPPLPQYCSHLMIYAHSAESNEKSIYTWLYSQFTGDTTGFLSVSGTKKKSFKSGKICRKDAQWVETNENQFFDFCGFFIYGRFCTQNWSKNLPILSTKTTIFQKLKIVKLIFHSFQHIPIFHVNMNAFEILKFFVEKHFPFG